MSVNLDLGDTRLIVAACKDAGLLRNQVAYVLATAYHETARRMKPVRETLASTDDEAIRILDRSWAAGKLPWVRTPYWRRDADGKSWLGRGYPQLTWKDNYVKAGQKLGLDLVSDPTSVMQTEVAIPILVIGMRDGWFTGKKLSDYITISKSDFAGARRIINGTERAGTVAGYAADYDKALKAIGYGVEPPKGA
jgi:hypothetical protein